MSQSLSRVLVHLVFSTKHRVAVLSPAIQPELHAYLSGVLNAVECPAIQTGGTVDHVHMLFGLSRTCTIADLVETVKTSSSKWLKTKGPEFAGFHWQGGYGAFSVSQSAADRVAGYICNQARHHRQMSFQDEFRGLLERHRVEYDERYVWD
jgi:putative transposase